MVARVQTNRVFNGRMYGRSRPNSCLVDVERSLDFELKLPYNDIGCDVEAGNNGKFSSDVVIQVLLYSCRIYTCCAGFIFARLGKKCTLKPPPFILCSTMTPL